MVTPMVDWLAARRADVYQEHRTEVHDTITGTMLDIVLQYRPLPTVGRVLDVGCGQAVALEKFRDRGHWAIGMTLGSDDANACAAGGHRVVLMDQTFLGWHDEVFDMIWCRHALEHAVSPMWTLHQFHRCLRPDGTLYVEVPAPDTVAHHERNGNHYSMFGRSAWRACLIRSGFQLVLDWDITFPLPNLGGTDTYWSFTCMKKS